MKTIKHFFVAVVILLQADAAFSQSWSLTGNAGTTNANFLGTTDNKKLKIKTNNQDRITINGNGKIGIGNTTPAQDLHLTGTMQIDRSSIGGNTTPAMILNGVVNNITTVLQVDGVQKSAYGYDVSTNDFLIATDDVGLRPDFIINRDQGFVGLNTKTPAERLHVMGNEILDGDLTMASSLGKGDINFTTEHQNIAFASPTSSTPSAMIYMTVSPTSFKRMVLAHSGAFSNWGLEYDDADDQFNFLGSGSNKFSIDLTDGNVAVGSATPTDRFEVHGGESSFFGNVGVQTAANTRTIQCGITQGALLGIGTIEFIQDFASSTLATSSDWIPTTDNTYSLGTSGNRWQDVWAVDGTINTSDATMKTNIRDMNYGIDDIMKLRPVSYQWKSDQSYTKLGVIAQEIQSVLPEVVRDWDYTIDEQTGMKTRVPSQKLGVMYDDIIPVLIKGMQDQQEQIEALQMMVTTLQEQVENLSGVQHSKTPSQTSELKSQGTLEQNIPNPAQHTTLIRYTVPTDATNAQLVITDQSGIIVQQFPHLTTGTSQVEISTAMLSSGTYQYSLYINGRKADSKQMIISK